VGAASGQARAPEQADVLKHLCKVVDKMDKVERKRFDWLPAEMPGVTRLMRAKRAEMGDAHVNECWKRGVIGREPGWFFAREGALMVGVPWGAADMLQVAVPTEALLILREVGHGAV
jgi:hypothetical protein